MDKDTEIAWAAGFIDGEGSMGFYQRSGVGRNSGIMRIAVSQKDDEPLYRLNEIFGCGNLTAHGQRDISTWKVEKSLDVLTVAEKIYPYLTHRRKQQIDNMRDAWKARDGRRQRVLARV